VSIDTFRINSSFFSPLIKPTDSCIFLSAINKRISDLSLAVLLKSTQRPSLIFFKIYLGSGSLTSPSETFNASTGFFIKLNEINTNGFVYSSNTGISYEINNNISLLVNIEYLKSYFVINNQKITFSGGSQDITPYFLKYDNIGINGGISFKF
jgi:hypothetical protein